MPSSSEKQRKYIFYLGGKYKTKSDTPEKFKWIWDSGWESIEEDHIERYKPFDFTDEDQPDKIDNDGIRGSFMYK